MPSPRYHDIFISYSHEDASLMKCVKYALEVANYRVWVDEQIQEGSRWRAQLTRILGTVGGVVYLASPHSYNSQYVEAELSIASDNDLPIFTLLIEGNQGNIYMPWNVEQYFDARGAKLPAAVKKLISAIYERFKSQLLYRPLRDMVEYLTPTYKSQLRAMIYRLNQDNDRLYLHTVFGIFMDHFLETTFRIDHGFVGKVWAKPLEPLILSDWTEYKKGKQLISESNMSDEQIDALDNLKMMIILPIFSQSYVSSDNKKDIIGVLVVDSPRSAKQLGLVDFKPLVDLCLRKTPELAMLLDIEDGNYPLSRIPPCDPLP